MPNSSQQRSQNWVPYLGVIVSVLGMVYTSGQLTSKVQTNTDNIGKVDARVSALDVRLTIVNDGTNSTNVRLARIEARLDMLLAEKDARR